MKLITDIRIYKSDIENVDGHSFPQDFDDKALKCAIKRVVMKLREYKFSLGDFDHLYINFTTVEVPNRAAPARRTVDKETKWFRFYDCQICKELFDKEITDEDRMLLLGQIESLLISKFASGEDDKESVIKSFKSATEDGESMLALYKSKENARHKAMLYLRFHSDHLFYPLLRVFDKNDNLVLERELKRERCDLLSLGGITLKKDSVTVYPKKNASAKDLEPQVFSFDG